jgi:hypothetical protein
MLVWSYGDLRLFPREFGQYEGTICTSVGTFCQVEMQMNLEHNRNHRDHCHDASIAPSLGSKKTSNKHHHAPMRVISEYMPECYREGLDGSISGQIG